MSESSDAEKTPPDPQSELEEHPDFFLTALKESSCVRHTRYSSSVFVWIWLQISEGTHDVFV
jgi:hypothetical protein